MPIDDTKIAALRARSTAGERLAVCEYIRVDWDNSTTVYYGAAAYHEVSPYTAIGVEIEPRLMSVGARDPFHSLELNPDLRTESVSITFDDIDKDITNKFQTYQSGVTVEFFLYYPAEDYHHPLWSGKLQAPEVYGWKTVKAVATNGFRSRESLLGSRRRPRECTAGIFGGKLPDAESIRSSLCPYDKHIGGSTGNYKTGTTPYSDCPKTYDACVARLGNNGLYFGGFNTDAAATVTSVNPYYLAQTKGNASALKEPIRVILGEMPVKESQLLLWRPAIGAQNPDHDWVHIICEVGEGPVDAIYNVRVNEKYVPQNYLSIRTGERGQPPTPYAINVSNFSSTAHFYAQHGWINASETTAADIHSDCKVRGFKEVCVYTDDDPVTKTRIYTTNRVWCLLEIYKNQKFGLGYAESRFTIADWITEAAYSAETITHHALFEDGEDVEYVNQRSTLNVILEGRQVGEQITDICRSGAISIPFEHEGEYTLRTFRVATTDELNNARVFYDSGSSVNICMESDGRPAIELSQIPADKLNNEIEVRFEEASNNGTERPLTVDDPNQKLIAGRQLGPDQSLPVVKKFTAMGVNNLPEAVHLAYRFLKFGESDTGGTQNNLKVKMTVPFEHALGLVRYDIIKVVSSLLDPFTIGTNNGVENLTETPQYFRILSMKKVAGNRCEITAQAYNHTAYTAFETTGGILPGFTICTVRGAGTETANGIYRYDGHVNDKPSYRFETNLISWSGTEWQLFVDGVEMYDSPDAVGYPWSAVWTLGTSGVSPEPEVLQGIRVDTGSENKAITAASYNASTGVLSVTLS